MIALKALSALLSYPDAELLRALPEIAQAIEASPLIAPSERAGVRALIDDLASGELIWKEERYVALFDRGRATSLNLFEHLHGESRDRGQAMVDLLRLYEENGFVLAARELPDYLPLVLEYLSQRSFGEAREMLADCAHILRKLAGTLLSRQSPYAAIPQALLAIAGEAPLDAALTESEPDEDVDQLWLEEPAFGTSSPLSSSAPAPCAARAL